MRGYSFHLNNPALTSTISSLADTSNFELRKWCGIFIISFFVRASPRISKRRMLIRKWIVNCNHLISYRTPSERTKRSKIRKEVLMSAPDNVMLHSFWCIQHYHTRNYDSAGFSQFFYKFSQFQWFSPTPTASTRISKYWRMGGWWGFISGSNRSLQGT